MNSAHPYWNLAFVPSAALTIAFLSIAFLAVVVGWDRLDDLLEYRRQRRLDAKASAEIRKQFTAQIPHQRAEGDAS